MGFFISFCALSPSCKSSVDLLDRCGVLFIPPLKKRGLNFTPRSLFHGLSFWRERFRFTPQLTCYLCIGVICAFRLITLSWFTGFIAKELIRALLEFPSVCEAANHIRYWRLHSMDMISIAEVLIAYLDPTRLFDGIFS